MAQHRARVKLRELDGPTNAAMAIHDALFFHGVQKRIEQAEILGESPTSWSRYLNGRTSIKVDRVLTWLRLADRAGYPLTLSIHPDSGCEAPVRQG